ncbi:hypothetical protein ACKFKG_12925 [Phormidesmis sp. 146-35]
MVLSICAMGIHGIHGSKTGRALMLPLTTNPVCHAPIGEWHNGGSWQKAH